MKFASTILMVRPAHFGFNEETAINNSFQQRSSFNNMQHKVLEEFDDMVAQIRSVGINVLVINDTSEPLKPDAVFPNNWFCTLPGGVVATFPMYAVNRRTERRSDIIGKLMHEYNVTEVEDWTAHEHHGLYLEGTGSMVMDHEYKLIYAATSERTNPLLLQKFADSISYTAVAFSAKDRNGLPVYHTNVLMCIGNQFCIVCDETIDEADKPLFFESIEKSGKQIISISYEQMNDFAGNMLQLQNEKGDMYLVMSGSAFDSLNYHQKTRLKRHSSLLPVDIPTIETIGGGSARCMMAEIFLAKKLA